MSTFGKLPILFSCAALLLLQCLASDLFAQRGDRGRGRGGSFDVTTILKRIDSNGNDILEPSEMRGRTQQMVRDVGLDPNRPHAISAIAKLLNDKNNPEANGANAAGDKDLVRNVPGFGVTVEPVGMRDFSPSGEERMSPEAMKAKFGDNVLAQVEGTLSRYDTSKNGILEPNEIQQTRWTNPSSQESDTNKDGNLSRLELAYRYQNREDEMKKRMEESRARRTPGNPNAATMVNPVQANNRFVQQGNVTTGRQLYPTTPASGNPRGFNSGSDAYVRYAEGLIKTYDKDGDGRLSEQELKEMRRPPKDADTNRDKFVDKTELIASVANRSETNTQGTGDQAAIHSGRSTPEERRAEKRRPTTATYNEADSIFGGKDANNDRQLQMHEFSQEWDDDVVKEFDSKDRNGDGVITENEWLGT